MTIISSFTLCPFANLSNPTNMKKGMAENTMSAAHATESSTRNRREMSNGRRGPTSHPVYSRQQHQYAPSRGHVAFQATPFQPLVHHRNLPENGVISPLKVGEYNFGMQQGFNTAPPQPLHSIVEMSGSACRPRLACDPPLSEIQIPCGPGAHSETEHDDECDDDDDDNDNSWIAGESGEENDYEEHSFERLESWKSMYFVAQRDLHVAREENRAVMDENRRLKRHLFELQRRLFESQRKRQRLASDMWKVPDASAPWSVPDPPKSLRRSPNPQQEQVDKSCDVEKKGVQGAPCAANSHRHFPRAISTEESSACRAEMQHPQKNETLVLPPL